MPGIVKVKILEGRNLPVMDKSADTTDAYVELKLGNTTYKTEVCRKSLNPQWHSEWFRFEMDDAELQDEPLQVRLMDHDTYSANDMIGKVYFNLNPLLLMAAHGTPGVIERPHCTSPRTGNISGWFPAYDTIHGLRGEINLIIKLDLFSDLNKFRQSSCGVHIFSASIIPYGYYAEQMYGFVEELVVEDDPEYQWIEKIRTPRASNEARQATFYKMSGELQRKIGLKVIELGGNAIIGYRQCYDLEGETGGVVVRGTGTAVKLNKCKKVDLRNSLFNPQFKIPDLIITSACGYNSAVPSDSCSVISLTDSLQSENFINHIQPEDRWSLCSFASGTSCNSRFTSIETLLDQENRKPVKSSSRLLRVAKYFRSSRLKNKHASKKKKSAQLRKFSVIEEYKQKDSGSASSAFVINDKVHESGLAENTEEIPGIKIPTSCVFHNAPEQCKSKYFNVTNNLNSTLWDETTAKIKKYENVDCDTQCIENAIKKVEKRSISSEDNLAIIEAANNSSKTLAFKELDKTDAGTDSHSKSDDNVMSEKTILVGTIRKPNIRRSNSFVSAINDGFWSIGNVSTKSTPADVRNSSHELFEATENKRTSTSGKEDSGNTSNLSARKLRRSNSFLLAIGDESTSKLNSPLDLSLTTNSKTTILALDEKKSDTNKGELVTDEQESFNISEEFRNSKTIESVFILKYDKIQKLTTTDFERCMTPPISKMTPYNPTSEKINKSAVKNVGFVSDYFPISESHKVNELPKHNEVLSEDTGSVKKEVTQAIPNTPPTNDNKLNSCISSKDTDTVQIALTNDNNDRYVITAAVDNCNILSEALTLSRLLTHANLNRNTTEGDKDEEDLSKWETSAILDSAPKSRAMSESAASVRCNEITKGTDPLVSENDPFSCPDTSDGRGINLVHKEHIEMMEYPFFTLSAYPEDFIVHLGGTVSARSVKLLGRISNIEEPETRDAWWTEIRVEIKAHMKALACNAVLNYQEKTSICDEVCILSATGTAAVIKVYDSNTVSVFDEIPKSAANRVLDSEQESKGGRLSPEDSPASENCAVFHIPYRKSSIPFPVKIKACEICRRGYVSDVLFVTIEPLERMPVIGQAAFIYAFAYRIKRDCKSELNAREISDGLPFLEYDLNRQLLNKVKIKGMNAIFSLKVQVSIGEKMITAYATGSAVLLTALSVPPELTLVAHGKWHHPTSRKKLNDARKQIEDTLRKNKMYYQLIDPQASQDLSKLLQTAEVTTSEQVADMEYYAGSKHTCVIEVDDENDIESISQLIDPNPPQGFLVSATERMLFGSLPFIPKKIFQLFAQVYRYRIPSNTPPSGFTKLFYRIVQAVYVKIHNRIPCSLNKVSFKMDIPEPDELQITIVATAIALKESERAYDSVSTSCSSVSELADDFILNADSEKDVDVENMSTFTPRKLKPKKRFDFPDNEIQITSLSYIPGSTIVSYLGYLNFVFIRESTMVKEQTGGVNNFVNNFIFDVTSMVKSHASGIGGNAVVNFFLNDCILITHSHKNQGQCLVNVGGDVVQYVCKQTA